MKGKGDREREGKAGKSDRSAINLHKAHDQQQVDKNAMM